MQTPQLVRLFRLLLKQGIAAGCVPFHWGGVRMHRRYRRAWPGGVPDAFSEKVQFKLLHDRRPILRTYADKLAVRDYVRGICPSVRLPRLLGEYSTLPAVLRGIPAAPWVMKAAHGSAMILICDRPDAVTREEVGRCAGRWLRTDYAVRYWEWQYLRLPRRILFEEYLGEPGRTPDDYKFYVMHQRVCLITVDQARYARHTRAAFWPDWSPTGAQIGPTPVPAVLPPRPVELPQMIRIAEQLACDSDFVRVDLYCVRHEIHFGEITHSPGGGNPCFSNRTFDEALGRYWTLPASYDARGGDRQAGAAGIAQPAAPSRS